jgi:hypothetical protein
LLYRTNAVMTHKNEKDMYDLSNQSTKHTACIGGCEVWESHVKPGEPYRSSSHKKTTTIHYELKKTGPRENSAPKIFSRENCAGLLLWL